jgi:hypothetical protein
MGAFGEHDVPGLDFAELARLDRSDQPFHQAQNRSPQLLLPNALKSPLFAFSDKL